jgi:hypothetical protein
MDVISGAIGGSASCYKQIAIWGLREGLYDRWKFIGYIPGTNEFGAESI